MDREKIYAQAVEWRRHFHRFPEVSTEEYGTQAYIAGILEQEGIAFRKYGTGIIAQLGKGEPCVALRADMDALRVKEETGLPFASEEEGKMHACGHDMHLAMLLGAVMRLKAEEGNWRGTVKVVFQPSEEKRPGGARLLLPHLLEEPVPRAIFGQHVYPGLPVGKIGIRAGAFFASSDNINFAVEGKGTHAAMPHLGSDPILAAVALIQYYQTIITKSRDPFEPAVLSITSIHGGTANNVIPDRVEVKGTVRTHNNALRHHIFNLINGQSPAICGLYGCRVVPDMPWNGLPPLVNDGGLVQLVREAAAGIAEVVEMPPLTLGEDFAIYLEHLPGAFWTLGIRPPEQEEMPPLHNPAMAPDERAIPIGVDLLFAACTKFLKEQLTMND